MMSFRRWLRKTGAILGPFVFSLPGGHFRSALTSQSVDMFGKPLPWYTYPAVDFLSILDFGKCNVAEFGAGNSTLWWAQRAKHVLALESDLDWITAIRRKAAPLANVEIKLVTSPEEAAKCLEPDFYDIIVVDDGSGIGPRGRPLNAATAFRLVKRTGLVVVDNADTNYEDYAIIKMANEGGWLRLDLIGHVAGATKRSCTSLFFRPEVSLLTGLAPPRFSQIRRADPQ